MEKYRIATGENKTCKNWKNTELTWEQLVKKLEKPLRTRETIEEFLRMKNNPAEKEKCDKIKDIGAFVGGWVTKGKDGKYRRKRASVLSRSLLTLDLDNAFETLFDKLEKTLYVSGLNYIVYSTHSHTLKNPRLRLILSFTQNLSSVDEMEGFYEWLAEEVTKELALTEEIDPTSYQRERLMYFPSCASDGEYYFKYKTDGISLDYSEYLKNFEFAEYTKVGKNIKWQKDDGTGKPGIIGAFNRTYDVTSCIDNFLTDIYEGPDERGRYTYKAGGGSSGLHIKDDGRLCQSYHHHDPARTHKNSENPRQCNAFDLIMIHKFDDDQSRIDECIQWCADQKYVKDDERYRLETFGPQWDKKHIKRKDDFDMPKLSKSNLAILLDHVGIKLKYNELQQQIEIDGRPWMDEDVGILKDLCQEYHFVSMELSYLRIHSIQIAKDNSYHPIREYLDNLPEWDGIKRIDTIFSTYFDAMDCEYTRKVARMLFAAAAKRIYEPGCEAQFMVVLSGTQEIGKSTFWRQIADPWFSDSMRFADMSDPKKTAEQVMGKWFLEFQEMAGMSKAELGDAKSCITSQVINCRLAYARATVALPMQCLLVGTINPDGHGYLRDPTGNRRWLTISVTKRLLDTLPRDQLWAEAKTFYKTEVLRLEGEAKKQAGEIEKENLAVDDKRGVIADYLDIKIPPSKIWDAMSIRDRQLFIQGHWEALDQDIKIKKSELVERTYVCPYDVWCECFQEPIQKMERRHSISIKIALTSLGWEVETKKRLRYYGPQRIRHRPDNNI